MKKFRTTIIVSVILICFSGFMLGKCSESMYCGIEFESSIYTYILNALIFICGLYSGGDIYERMLSVSDVSEQKLYERLNQFNLANYTSLSRIKDMSGNVLWTTMCVLAMIVFVVGVLCVYIKKVDLLKKS